MRRLFVAGEVTETLDLVQGGIDDIDAAVDAARDSDADAYIESLDNTGSTGDPTGDDPTGSGE